MQIANLTNKLSLQGVKFSRPVLPGFGLTFGITITFVSIFIIIPFIAIFWQLKGVSWGEFSSAALDDRAIATYKLTFGSALVATVINTVFGLLLAWVITQYNFWGKRILDAMIDLPFALPTSVAGVAMVALYDKSGAIGGITTIFGFEIAYTWVGIMIAMMFTSLPFGVRTVQPVLEKLDQSVIDASKSLGANDIQVFVRIILPKIFPALITGFSLALARSLGEFGAIIFIAGNIPYETEITSLLMMIKLEEFDYVGASAIAVLVLGVSILILSISGFLQAYTTRHLRKS